MAEVKAIVERRSDVLATLRDDALEKRELIDELGVSRSTVDRAIEELVSVDLVSVECGRYRTTLAGRICLERFQAYVTELEETVAAQAVLEPLPKDCALPIDAVAGSERIVSAGAAAYRPLERLSQTMGSATALSVLLGRLPDARLFRRWYDHVVVDENVVHAVVSEPLFEALQTDFPRRLAAMEATDQFSLRVGPTPPYGLVVTAGSAGPAVTIVVFEADGGVHGLLENDRLAARHWATWVLAEYGPVKPPRTDGVEQADRVDAVGWVPTDRWPAAAGADRSLDSYRAR